MRHQHILFGGLVSAFSAGTFALGACTVTEIAPPGADAALADAVVADTQAADAATTDANVTDATIGNATVTDATVTDSGTDSSTPTVTCGVLGDQVFDPIKPFVGLSNSTADVTVLANVCAGPALVIPYNGTSTLTIPRNTPFFFQGTQAGNMPTLSRENNVKSNVFPKLAHEVLLLPESYAVQKDPTWTSATKALLRVIVNASTGSGACSTKDGVSYTVVNHPEAVISYAGGGTTATGTGTDAFGSWISIVTTGTLAAPEYVTITQTKAGCKVAPNGADLLFSTGRAPIAAGALTSLLNGEVTNP